MRRVIKLGALLSVGLVASCSYELDLSVVQEGARTVFAVENRPEFCPSAVAVGAGGVNGLTSPIWSIAVEDRATCVRRFEYGVAPAGWRQIVAPKPLSPDAIYVVNVGAPGADGYKAFQRGAADGPISRAMPRS